MSHTSLIEDRLFQGAPVLVTGGCGFIGSHLVEWLAMCGANVTVLDNLQAGQRSNLSAIEDRVRMVEGDLRDRATVEQIVQETRPRYVFHLAANASVPGSVADPVYDFETNCAGTFTLLNALRTTGGCEKVLVTSSGAVYGEPASFPITESDPLRPISPYGASKLASEVEAQVFQKVYGLPLVVVRLFNTYGPRMARFVILDFLRKLQRDPTHLEILGTGRQVRDFTYVADTVAGMGLLAALGEAGEAYNLSSGAYCSVTELAQKMLAALELTGKTEISYTGQSWIGDAQRWEVSIEKIRALGYRACFSLEAGLEQTIAWFCDSQNLPRTGWNATE